MSTGLKYNSKKQFKRVIAEQLVLDFDNPVKFDRIVNNENCCPCCGADDFVNACHFTCSHCGFSPTCND